MSTLELLKQLPGGLVATSADTLPRHVHTGGAPLVLAIDHGLDTTRVRAVQGNHVFGETEYPTPTSYLEILNALSQAKERLVGNKQPNASGLSVAGSVSLENGKPRVEPVGELQQSVIGSFAEGVAAAINARSADDLVVFSQGTAGAYAELTAPDRREPARDEAFYAWIGGDADGAVYTPEKKIYPDRPDQTEAQDMVTGMQLILERHGQIGLYVAKVALAASPGIDEATIHAVNKNSQTIRRPTLAPRITEATSGERTPLIGALRAANRLARTDQRPHVIYPGLRRA